MAVLAVLLLLPGKTAFLGNLYSFGAMLSFTIAHIAVVALRYRQPDRPRPYRAPWNVRVRAGARSRLPPWSAPSAPPRPSCPCDPRTTHKLEREQRPPDFAALGYETAIVPIFGTDLNARALLRAAKLLGPDAVVYALYVLQVPARCRSRAAWRPRRRRAAR